MVTRGVAGVICGYAPAFEDTCTSRLSEFARDFVDTQFTNLFNSLFNSVELELAQFAVYASSATSGEVLMPGHTSSSEAHLKG